MFLQTDGQTDRPKTIRPDLSMQGHKKEADGLSHKFKNLVTALPIRIEVNVSFEHYTEQKNLENLDMDFFLQISITAVAVLYEPDVGILEIDTSNSVL